MAVALEFINIVVPIAIIDAKYPGGWDAYRKEWEVFLGLSTWHDETLLREGAMSPHDIESMIRCWEEHGLTPYKEVEGVKHWQDICVLDSFSGPTLPCDWIEWDNSKNIAWHKNGDKENIVGRRPDIEKFLANQPERLPLPQLPQWKHTNTCQHGEGATCDCILDREPAEGKRLLLESPSSRSVFVDRFEEGAILKFLQRENDIERGAIFSTVKSVVFTLSPAECVWLADNMESYNTKVYLENNRREKVAAPLIAYFPYKKRSIRMHFHPSKQRHRGTRASHHLSLTDRHINWGGKEVFFDFTLVIEHPGEAKFFTVMIDQQELAALVKLLREG